MVSGSVVITKTQPDGILLWGNNRQWKCYSALASVCSCTRTGRGANKAPEFVDMFLCLRSANKTVCLNLAVPLMESKENLITSMGQSFFKQLLYLVLFCWGINVNIDLRMFTQTLFLNIVLNFNAALTDIYLKQMFIVSSN